MSHRASGVIAAVAFLLAGLFALPALAADGHLALLSSGGYGEPATFEWTLAKRPQYPTLGVFCNQGGWRYIAELSVPRALSGQGSVLIENEMSSALPGSLDYTEPAACQAYVWDEYRGGRDPKVLTNQAFFEVLP